MSDFHLMTLPVRVTEFLVKVEEFKGYDAICTVVECPGNEGEVGKRWLLRADSHIVRTCNEALRINIQAGKYVAIAATGGYTKAGMRAWAITGVGDAPQS